jgi:hypothetical protein
MRLLILHTHNMHHFALHYPCTKCMKQKYIEEVVSVQLSFHLHISFKAMYISVKFCIGWVNTKN